MTIPTKYPAPPEAVVSYDFVDFAAGTGVETFYALTAVDTGGTNHLLSSSLEGIRSATVTTQLSASGGSNTTLNFDLTAFNTPRTVRGTAYISVSIGCHNTNVGNVSAEFFHWDGTTATSISSEITSSNFTGSSGAETGAEDFLLEVPLTETSFKVGEQLRLAIKLTKVSGGAAEIVEVGHDPNDRDGSKILPASSTHTTILTADVPFKIDN